ncbi:hypothetical protein DMP07_05080 [Slackia faecicanis]|uniref:Uncharacterized protein n=1 Tax=Slackia faecicanis TaxID=255723 RepID=A0A3N0AER5_9ACTN|nr:exodeoxyribonuclease VII small subunit [Slackia faecicanis]MDO5358741.1 exodeoxyribonuclease VII small subunit [Slackia faecicanis]RNL19757.1 hypothetical protein DMP07_05080 [Slackia faecicanis]
MSADEQTRSGFAAIRDRLDEIAAQVRDDAMPLDAALDLYDEAVKLGMKATELLETIEEGDHAESGEEAR